MVKRLEDEAFIEGQVTAVDISEQRAEKGLVLLTIKTLDQGDLKKEMPSASKEKLRPFGLILYRAALVGQKVKYRSLYFEELSTTDPHATEYELQVLTGPAAGTYRESVC